MASQKDVRAIALSLPGVREVTDGFGFAVDTGDKPRKFVWAWRERVYPKKPKVPRADVVVVRVAGPDDKATLLAVDVDKFFTEPHYDGYPAVLVRLPAVSRAELRAVIAESHRSVTAAADRKARPARSRPGGGGTRTRAGRR